MKILIFTDLHAQYEYIEELTKKSKDADLVISLGDHTLFDNGTKEFFDFLESLNKPCLVIHGNHEPSKETREECEKRLNIEFMHKKYLRYQGILFIGHGGGGFTSIYPSFENLKKEFSDAMKTSEKTILLTHAPPINTKLDLVPGVGHVGSKTYREFIEKNQPTLSISGHIHDTFGIEDKIGKTKLINPGPKGMIINI
ncbi:metallophosphoesterase [Candidatus Woesearchaeota archaeon]|nr:metallophosphoesterase [Candidatus Woesearchaeota archaeon]MCF7900984.1 metallophosphoesterase [Candidatus Woesearchaeota archaeon]MCF8013300.1 metallophosphoesterase [Candidatus Woesearchaeota archaeon]